MFEINSVLSKQFIERAIANSLIDEKCSQLHPAESCKARALRFLVVGCLKFAKLYFFKLFVLHMLFRRKGMMKSPLDEIKNFLKSFARSMLFGGTYIGIGSIFMCLVTTFYGSHGGAIMGSGGTSGGIALAIENRSKQPEIALFIFTQTLNTMYNMAKRRNLNPGIPEGFSIIYALSMAVICYQYFNDRENLRRGYCTVIDKFLADS